MLSLDSLIGLSDKKGQMGHLWMGKLLRKSRTSCRIPASFEASACSSSKEGFLSSRNGEGHFGRTRSFGESGGSKSSNTFLSLFPSQMVGLSLFLLDPDFGI